MRDNVIVYSKDRDGDLLRPAKKMNLTVGDLWRLVQSQRALEREALNKYAAVSSFWLNRPMPNICVSGMLR